MSGRRHRCLGALLLLLSGGLSGCVGHVHRVGVGPTGVGEASARQLYLFFGLMTVNEVDIQRLTDNLTGYAIETEFSFVDLLLTPFLLPFTMTSRTVTVHK